MRSKPCFYWRALLQDDVIVFFLEEHGHVVLQTDDAARHGGVRRSRVGVGPLRAVDVLHLLVDKRIAGPIHRRHRRPPLHLVD